MTVSSPSPFSLSLSLSPSLPRMASPASPACRPADTALCLAVPLCLPFSAISFQPSSASSPPPHPQPRQRSPLHDKRRSRGHRQRAVRAAQALQRQPRADGQRARARAWPPLQPLPAAGALPGKPAAAAQRLPPSPRPRFPPPRLFSLTPLRPPARSPTQAAAAGLGPQRKRFFRSLVALLDSTDLEIVVCSVLLLAMSVRRATGTRRIKRPPHCAHTSHRRLPISSHPAFFSRTKSWGASSSAPRTSAKPLISPLIWRPDLPRTLGRHPTQGTPPWLCTGKCLALIAQGHTRLCSSTTHAPIASLRLLALLIESRRVARLVAAYTHLPKHLAKVGLTRPARRTRCWLASHATLTQHPLLLFVPALPQGCAKPARYKRAGSNAGPLPDAASQALRRAHGTGQDASGDAVASLDPVMQPAAAP